MELPLPLPIRGLFIGFTIAAAVGPISLLTIRRTLAHGQLYGFVSGLGVATADATYAAIAAFGLTALTSVLVSGHLLLGLVGGLIIAVLGVRTMLSKPGEVASDAARPGLPAAFASIYVLTMTNPMTILSFAALFVGLGVIGQGGPAAAGLVAGVFVGSMAWWIVLTFAVSRLRTRVTPAVLRWVTVASGLLVAAFGVAAIVSGVRG
jgi:threonine/homoserine/homoserine lactone efflux protein